VRSVFSFNYLKKGDNMIKLLASHSEKRSKDFNSTGFSASMELEVGNTASVNEIQERLHKAYFLLRKTIAEEIGNENTVVESFSDSLPASKETNHRWKRNGGNGSGRGGGNGQKARMASQAQCKAIFAISHSLDLQRSEIIDMVQDQFGASRVEDLQMREASQFIEELKSMQTRH